MAYDYKKEFPGLYRPSAKPAIVDVPPMNFLAVRGSGNPNEKDGPYSEALGLLYGASYTIKMSYKGAREIEGYFAYVVPPLEGLWWQQGGGAIDYSRKEGFHWISLIRLPDFVTKADVEWAVGEAGRKKGKDFSAVALFPYHEGLCVQCMHTGPYDDEPATIAAMEAAAQEAGYEIDSTPGRYHHEIYLGDPRKTDPARLKTVIRQPVVPLGPGSQRHEGG